ncbi:hypothetical protein SAMD00019534_043830, partial [Acytostelium subglobosum LB1]|uniref:hypothetical protein n=1 Tax=Acytostelium subglobosum LB1 TaxID=1410327 RepID=UPI0006447C24
LFVYIYIYIYVMLSGKSSLTTRIPFVILGSLLMSMGIFFSRRLDDDKQQQQQQCPTDGLRDDCIFCSIVKENNVSIYQDDDIYVFRDRYPKASTHYLVIPKIHIKSVRTLTPDDLPTVLKMKQVALQLTESMFPGKEYRLGFHVPPFYSVPHLHMHLLVEPFTPSFKRFNYTPHLGGLWYRSVDMIIESLSKDSS